MIETEATTVLAPMSSSSVPPNQEKNKKRSRPNNALGTAPAKRPRTKKDPPEQPKVPKFPRTVAKPRDTPAKVKKTGSVAPIWSVVSASDLEPSEKLQSKPVDIRPRLWSSTREELVSTFVEIAGSKCVNNISWLFTEMPILILDDELVSLEKIQDNDNGLYMDIIFTRECHYKGPSIFPMGSSSNAANNTVDPQSPAAPPPISVQPNNTHDDRAPGEETSTQLNVQPPNVSLQRDPQAPDSLARRAPTAISNSVISPGEASQRDGPIEKVQDDKSITPPQTFNQLSGHKSTHCKTNSVLSSLKFKKNKPTVDISASPLPSSQLPQPEPSFPEHPGGPLPPNPPSTSLSYFGHHSFPERNPVQFQIRDPSQALPSMGWHQRWAGPGLPPSIQTCHNSFCGCTGFRSMPNCIDYNSQIPGPILHHIAQAPITSPEMKLDPGRPILPSEVTLTTASSSAFHHFQYQPTNIYPGISRVPTLETIVPALGPCDPNADITTTSALSSQKSTGKKKEEKLPEPGVPHDNESLPSAKHHSSKKRKLLKDVHIEGAQANPQEVPISSSSRIKVEDLPPYPRTAQVLTVKEFSDDITKQSISSNSNEIRTTKVIERRKRKRKAEAEGPSDAAKYPKTEVDEQPSSTKGFTSLADCINSISSGAKLTQEPKSQPKPKPRAKQYTVTLPPLQGGENDMPLPIPEELQALVDAYINSTPVGIFASGGQLREFWRLKLKRREEIGYAFMGFYRVLRVWEAVSGVGEAGGTAREGPVSNQDTFKCYVQWRFRMGWEPGGEDWQVHERDNLSSPWWNPTLKVQGLWTSPQPEKEDSDDESTTRYRISRRENLNFPRRHCLFNQIFFSVLPLHLLAPVNAEIPDSAFPRGWHCRDCGKLNFRYHLRHRICTSSYCQVEPEACGYAVELDRLRDPQDRLPLSLPLNELPSCGRVDTKVQAWEGGMKTLFYDFRMGNTENAITVHHVFTCNSTRLQGEPSELFNLLQIHVPLRRATVDINSSPYFTHLVGDVEQAKSTWDSAHECLLRAKEFMLDRVRKYVHKTGDDVNISRLEIRAWVTTGSKRGSEALCAKQRCIIVMCLGCEAIMSISPKSAIVPNDNQTHIPDLDKLIPMDSFDPKEDQLQIQSGEGVKLEAELVARDIQKQMVSSSRIPSRRVSTMGTTQKRDKIVLTVSLVHGDIMVLAGDDFEYSIKRTGTSILLIGS